MNQATLTCWGYYQISTFVFLLSMYSLWVSYPTITILEENSDLKIMTTDTIQYHINHLSLITANYLVNLNWPDSPQISATLLTTETLIATRQDFFEQKMINKICISTIGVNN